MSGKATWYAVKKTDDAEAEVTIYDEIGSFGVGAKQFIAEIARLKDKHLHVRINSPGGSVIDGTAIFNALRRHAAGVTVHIDALAASMASVIAMAGQTVRIADNALMMIHNPWTISMGDSADLRKEADLLDKLKANIRNAYSSKTGMDDDRIQEMMDGETWLDALEAVALGFADEIEEGIPAAASVTREKAKAQFDSFRQGMNEKASEIQDAVEDVVEVAAPAVEEIKPDEVAEIVEAPAAEEAAPEEVKDDVPAEPQAAVNAASLLAKVNDLVAQNSLLSHRAAAAEEALAQLEKSLGLAAAKVEPVIAPSEPVVSLLDTFNAIQSPEEKSAFYKKHQAALRKLIK